MLAVTVYGRPGREKTMLSALVVLVRTVPEAANNPWPGLAVTRELSKPIVALSIEFGWKEAEPAVPSRLSLSSSASSDALNCRSSMFPSDFELQFPVVLCITVPLDATAASVSLLLAFILS